jgi:hypothetical protein
MSETGRVPNGPSAPQDAALLARARDGDIGAFEAVAAARLTGGWRLSRAILGSDPEASAAVTNALLAAWRELPRLEDLERFDGWLDRILISECRMRLNGAGRSEIEGTTPPDLLESTMAAVRASPPRPVGTARSPGHAGGGRGGGAWIAAVALAAIVCVAAAVIIVPQLAANRGSAGVDPPASPSPARTPSAVASGEAVEPPTPSPALPADEELHVGSLAMVTLDGDNLRVRSAPGVGDASKRFKPLLPAGTRLFVVGGPVESDGHTWWEVQTDSELVDLFGWVAAAGDAKTWVTPTTPRCYGTPDADAVTGLTPVDFLACHGNAEVRIQAEAAVLWDVREAKGDCGWVRKRDGCDIDAAWLLLAATRIRVQTGDGGQSNLVVAMPPDLAAALAGLPRHQSLTLTVSMDSPEAQTCGARDAETGATLVPRDQAVTRCRLQFVVQEVAFRQ